MPIPTKWKIIGAGVVVAGLGLGTTVGAATSDDGRDVARISLRDRQAVATADTPATVGQAGDDGAAVDRSLGSPDGESLDSPLQSADDSAPGQDSLDTPVASLDSPPPAPAPAPAPVYVAPAPAPAPVPAPAPAPQYSGDSVSVDSGSSFDGGGSFDSP